MAASRSTIVRHQSDAARWEMVASLPHPALRPYVRRYCGYAERSAAPFRRREVASGEAALIISFGPPILVHMGAGAGPAQRRVSFVAGPDDSYAVTEHAGTQHGVQIDFTPHGAHMFFGVAMHTLAHGVVELEDLLGREAERLATTLAEAPDWNARFDLLDARIGARLAQARSPAPDSLWAWRRLKATHGLVTIGSLSGELGCSRRHLAARFREQIGLPPKTLARILRFQRVVSLLERDGGRRWVEIAHDCGYYDQPHFNRDFREFAGSTPSEVLARRLPDGGGISG